MSSRIRYKNLDTRRKKSIELLDNRWWWCSRYFILNEAAMWYKMECRRQNFLSKRNGVLGKFGNSCVGSICYVNLKHCLPCIFAIPKRTQYFLISNGILSVHILLVFANSKHSFSQLQPTFSCTYN